MSEVDDRLVYHQQKVADRFAHEHLDAFFNEFRCADPLYTTDLRRMMPTGLGVWSFHPPMLRVYGWVPRPHSFVAVGFELADDTKGGSRLNDVRRDEVLKFIADHGIAEVLYGDVRDAFPR
jgi:hypothetical protein